MNPNEISTDPIVARAQERVQADPITQRALQRSHDPIQQASNQRVVDNSPPEQKPFWEKMMQIYSGGGHTTLPPTEVTAKLVPKKAKNLGKAAVHGVLPFGIGKKLVGPREKIMIDGQEMPDFDEKTLEILASYVPFSRILKGIGRLVDLGKKLGPNSKLLGPALRVGGWGVVGATEKAANDLLNEKELPSVKDIAIHGGEWALIDASLQLAGLAGQFGKSVGRLAEEMGVSRWDILKKLSKSLKNYGASIFGKGGKIEPEIIQDALNQVAKSGKVTPPFAEVTIPVTPTEKGLVVSGTKMPVPYGTKDVKMPAKAIDPFSPTNNKIEVEYVPPEEPTKSAREQIAEHVVREYPEQKDTRTIKEKIHDSARKLQTAVFDEYAPIREVSEKAYQLANLAKGSSGRALLVLEESMYDHATKELTGPGFKQIFDKNVISQIPGFNHADLDYYLVAGSSLDRQKLGQKNPIPTDAAVQFIKENEKYYPIAKQLHDFQDQGLKNETSSGFWSKEQADKAREDYQTYAPLYRFFEGVEQKPIRQGKNLKPKDTKKRAKGSTRKIISPTQSIVRNAIVREQMIAKNDAMNALRDALEKIDGADFKAEDSPFPMIPQAELQRLVGDDWEVVPDAVESLSKAFAMYNPKAFTPEPGTIHGFRDGKRWVMRGIPDELAQAVQGMNPVQLNLFDKLANWRRKMFSRGALMLPDTQLGLTLTDQFLAGMTTKYPSSRIPLADAFKSLLVDFPRAIFDVFGKSDLYKDFLLSGAYQQFLRDIDPDDLRLLTMDYTNETLVRTKTQIVKDVLKLPKYMFRAYEDFWNKLSQATKVAEFRRAINKLPGNKAEKITQAGFDALEMTLNYSRKGSSRGLNMLTSWMPFSRVLINSVGKTAEMAVAGGGKGAGLPPSEKTVNEENARRRTTNFWTSGLGLASMSLYLWYVNKDDPRYQAIPEKDKSRYWYIYLTNDPKEQPIKIRKLWDIGIIFQTLPEAIARYIFGKDPHAFDSLQEGVKEELNPITIAGKANIVPERQKRIEAQYQAVSSTSETAKLLGEYLNVSPIYIDAAINAVGARFAMLAVNAIDDIFLDKKNRKPAQKKADSIFYGRFFARGPSSRSSYAEHYYELYNRMNTIEATKSMLKKEKRFEELKQYSSKNPYVDMKMHQQKIKERILKIDAIRSNPTIAPEKKQEMLDDQYIELTNLYKVSYEDAKTKLEKSKK